MTQDAILLTIIGAWLAGWLLVSVACYVDYRWGKWSAGHDDWWLGVAIGWLWPVGVVAGVAYPLFWLADWVMRRVDPNWDA